MANKICTTLTCPKCGFGSDAEIRNMKHKFLIFRCPSCNSNVVIYKNKIDTISDQMVRSLLMSKKLQFCGAFVPPEEKAERKSVITKDDILNLRILLGNEDDAQKLISQL